MKGFLFLVPLQICFLGFTQNVGIGISTPAASSKLEISSTNSGLLIPRVELISVSNGSSPISSPATSLIVYNTNASIASGSGTGYYFWNGSAWERLFSGTIAPNWTLIGNTGTSAVTNFIGTTDAIDFVTRTNNVERMRVTSGGNIGVGVNPSYKFDVNHVSSTPEDHAVNIDFTTSAAGIFLGPSQINSGLYVNSISTGTGDLYGVWSIATPNSTGNASAFAGVVNSIGLGDRIVIASQLAGSGDDGAGLSAAVTGSWTNAYGLYVDFTASSSSKNYGIYVKGTPTYSAFLENGNLYVNDNVSIGVNADPALAKLHVDGNIKSTFLEGVGSKRILYTDNNGQITPLPNGVPGDVLTLGADGIPVWGTFSSQIYFEKLQNPASFGASYASIVSKSFTPVNDTVLVEFNMNMEVSTGSGTVSPLSTFEITLESNGTTITKAYCHPNTNAVGGKMNVSFTIPVETFGGVQLFEVFIQRISAPTISVTTNPFNSLNATLTIYDLPTN